MENIIPRPIELILIDETRKGELIWVAEEGDDDNTNWSAVCLESRLDVGPTTFKGAMLRISNRRVQLAGFGVVYPATTKPDEWATTRFRIRPWNDFEKKIWTEWRSKR